MQHISGLMQRAHANAEEGRKLGDAFRERVAKMSFADLCPEQPWYCTGEIRSDPKEDGLETWIDCPHADSDCPHKEPRARTARAKRLRQLEFGEEAQYPTWERVPGDLKGAVETYRETLEERLNEGDGLTIGGNVGAGKTCCLALIATAIMPTRDELSRGFAPGKLGIVYTSALKLFNILHRAEGDLGATTCDLLLLDDLGTEYPSGFALSQFHELMDERWANRRSTVVTTNRQKDDLANDASIGRIFDRLKQRNPYVATAVQSQRQEAKVSDWKQGPPPEKPREGGNERA